MFNWNKTYMVCLLSFVLLFVQMIFVINILWNKEERPVYCLMVTGYNKERLSMARKSIQNFKQQTYKNKNLIILNQSKERLIKKESKDTTVLEVLVDKEDKTLGELRNMSLQFVPPNAIWTTWDDDDYRSSNYIKKMVHIMNKNKAEFLMFQNRIEYNKTNNFSFKMTMKSGFMTFFSVHNPFLEYEHVSTSEDVKVKNYALKHMKTYIYDNDPKMYIRLIHDDNTSIYVHNKKKQCQKYKKQ